MACPSTRDATSNSAPTGASHSAIRTFENFAVLIIHSPSCSFVRGGITTIAGSRNVLATATRVVAAGTYARNQGWTQRMGGTRRVLTALGSVAVRGNRCALMTWSARELLLFWGRPIAGHCPLLPHSYRSASTGSSFAACIAGSQPLITPTKIRINVERNSVVVDKVR